MNDLYLLLGPTVAGFAAAVIADRKNRGGTGWGVMSFILPVLVLVVVFLGKIDGDDPDRRGPRGVRKWIGIPLGLLFVMAGLSLLLHENPAAQVHWLTGMGLGAFLVWRSFAGAKEPAR